MEMLTLRLFLTFLYGLRVDPGSYRNTPVSEFSGGKRSHRFILSAIDSFYQPSIHFYHDDDSEISIALILISIAILLETTISWVFGQRKH